MFRSFPSICPRISGIKNVCTDRPRLQSLILCNVVKNGWWVFHFYCVIYLYQPEEEAGNAGEQPVSNRVDGYTVMGSPEQVCLLSSITVSGIASKLILAPEKKLHIKLKSSANANNLENLSKLLSVSSGETNSRKALQPVSPTIFD